MSGMTLGPMELVFASGLVLLISGLSLALSLGIDRF
jgi:hypothetical protein